MSDEGIYEIGHCGDGFAFDNELPRHKVYLAPFKLAARLVSNAEYLEFMNDRGYSRPELWLSDGWDIVQAEKWQAPLYWEEHFGNWRVFTMAGMQRDGFARAGVPRQLLRSRRFRALGGRAPLPRGRVGGGGGRSAAFGEPAGIAATPSGCRGAGKFRPAPDVWRCLGVDRKRLFGISRLPTGIRRARRIQRQVHVQPICVARRFLRHSAFASSSQLSKLFPSGRALAVFRHSIGTRRQLKHNGNQQRALSNSNHSGGCSRWPEPTEKMSAAKAFLRRARVRIVRADLRTSRVLSDPDRARHSGEQYRCHRGGRRRCPYRGGTRGGQRFENGAVIASAGAARWPDHLRSD